MFSRNIITDQEIQNTISCFHIFLYNRRSDDKKSKFLDMENIGVDLALMAMTSTPETVIGQKSDYINAWKKKIQ